MKPYILAMDLEGTLISHAINQIPRPGLYEFLESMRLQFDRLVMFTTVPETLVRKIGHLLASEGAAPSWFHLLDYIEWSGKTRICAASPRCLARRCSWTTTNRTCIRGNLISGSKRRCSLLPTTVVTAGSSSRASA